MKRRRTRAPGPFELILLLAIVVGLVGSSRVWRSGGAAILALALGLVLAVGLIVYFDARSRIRRRRLMAVSLTQADRMTGAEFEAYIARLLQQIGYRRVQVTKASGDFGADIVATWGKDRLSIQVKCYGPDRKG